MERLDVISTLSTHTSQIESLERDRARQNGTLDRLEAKLDGLVFKILTAAGAFGLASVGWLIVLLKHG